MPEPKTPSPLPVDRTLPELKTALSTEGAAVLVAPTGAGKTTRVPPALLDLGPDSEIASKAGATGRIVMLEPRRVAARAAARRMAMERGWHLGEEVGYQVRFDRRWREDTRIVVVTEGLLLQWLQRDPFLQDVSAVIFDELHERGLASDLALAMVRKIQLEVRPDLKIVAMSATLEPGPVAEFLGGCPIIESRGRLHPVEILYRPAGQPGGEEPPVAARAVAGIHQALALLTEKGDHRGGVLAFLPGVGEIRKAMDLLKEVETEGHALFPLYGDLPPERQDAALAPLTASRVGRKIVLATNVAETSVTVEGIAAVVDTGLARILRLDAATGLDRLELSPISRAAADQRSGRAGRQGPGICLRLWPEHEHRGRPERETPEIARVDLTSTLLQLHFWGENDPAAFPWFEPPDPARLRRAETLLEELETLGEQGLTAIGRTLARLPIHPRLGRLLVEGHRLGHLELSALAAALTAERGPFRLLAREERASPPPSSSDLLDRIEGLRRFEKTGRPPGHPSFRFHRGAARFVLRARDQLLDLIGRELGREEASHCSEPEALGRALLVSYPDRLARRRAPGSASAVMVGGRGVRLVEETAVREAEIFVCVEMAGGRRGERSEALVRVASGVERAWLPAEKMAAAVEVEFDPGSARVVAFQRERYLDLILSEREVPPDPERAAEVLARAASERLDAALDFGDPVTASFLTRMRCLSEWVPELDLPKFGEPELRALLPALCAGRRSFAELRRLPLADILRGSLSREHLGTLDQGAPERLEVPSGNRIRLAYEEGKPPVLAARIQELFGLRQTPRVAQGRVPVLLHLLAPNMRPQQVTQDLEGFWQRTYPEVRKELQGRYPKHSWPDDPLDPRAAPAERRPRKRR